MKIVILDSYGANPGDLSWDGLNEVGPVTIYDRTKPEETVDRAAERYHLQCNSICRRTPQKQGVINRVIIYSNIYKNKKL